MRQFLAGALALIAIVGGATGAMAQTAFAPAANWICVRRRRPSLMTSGEAAGKS